MSNDQTDQLKKKKIHDGARFVNTHKSERKNQYVTESALLQDEFVITTDNE